MASQQEAGSTDLFGCSTCGAAVAKQAPLCMKCGAPHPSGHFQAEVSWRNLAPSFGRLTGSTFLGVLLWSLLPLLFWLVMAMMFGAALTGS